MLIDHPWILPLLRALLESFFLVLLGGMFVLGEASLKTAKENTERSSRIYHLRPIFRFIAVFIFVFTAVMTTDTLETLFPSLQGWKHFFAFTGVFIFLTLTILLFGIVLPRALGESSTTSIIAKITWPVARAAVVAIRPIALMMEHLTARFLKCFGLSLHATAPASDEEVIHILDEGLHSGVFNASEKKMVERVLDLDDQLLDDIMTPRSQFVWLNLDDTEENNWCCIAKSGHSEFPVFQGTHDHLAGIVSVKSLWANISLAGSVKLSDVIAMPLYVPATMTASQLIEEFRSKKCHTALVVDEFGVVEGIVTMKDVFEAIVGILPEREVKQHYPKLIQKTQNSWMVDAGLNFEEAREALDMPLGELNEEETRYQTIGGFFLHHLGHVPHEGEFIIWKSFRFEVLKMNRHRIEQLVVMKIV
ncbi:MAG: hemolysin family protein [Verrucomicrobiota bacterium]